MGSVTLADDEWPISTSGTFWLAVAPNLNGKPHIMCSNCGSRHPNLRLQP
jgi:hypothetical protein